MNNSIEHAICFETCYYKPNDITFIMKRTYKDNSPVETEEVINFYHGEPNPNWTDYYIAQYYLKIADKSNGGKNE